MRLQVPLTIALLSLALCGCGSNPKVRQLNAQVFQLIQNGQSMEAIPLAKEAIRLDPNDAEAHKNLGTAYGETNQFDLAVQELKTAIRLRPNYDKAYFNLGRDYWVMGKYDESIAASKEAIRINPGYMKAYHNIAISLRDSGRTKEAIQTYREILQRDPSFVLAYIQLGTLLHQQKQYTDALNVLKKGQEVEPGFSEMYRVAGAAYRDMGDLPHAIAEWKKSVELDPESYVAYRSLASAYTKMHQPAKAADAQEHVRKLASAAARDFYNDGTLALTQNRYEDAIKPLQEALRLDPGKVEASINLASAYKGAKQYAAALQIFREIQARDPRFIDAPLRIGSVLYDSGDHAGGRAEWQKLANSSNPELATIANRLLKENP